MIGPNIREARKCKLQVLPLDLGSVNSTNANVDKNHNLHQLWLVWQGILQNLSVVPKKGSFRLLSPVLYQISHSDMCHHYNKSTLLKQHLNQSLLQGGMRHIRWCFLPHSHHPLIASLGALSHNNLNQVLLTGPSGANDGCITVPTMAFMRVEGIQTEFECGAHMVQD